MNDLFSMLGNPFRNIQGMMAQIQQLKNQFGNRDPEDIINRMLQNGQINQAQVDQAKQMAEQFRSMMR